MGGFNLPNLGGGPQMGGGFNLPNLTIGGGTTFTQQLIDLLKQLGTERQVRAGLGQDLFTQLLGAQLEANRRPISLVDQLLLSGQVGSVFPLSQAGEELRGRFTTRPQTNLLGDLQRRLEQYSVGALTPGQQVAEGYDPNSGLPLTPGQEEYIRRLPGARTDAEFRRPQRFQYGGRLRIDPNRLISTPGTAAGPASVIDRTGRSVALMGEAGRPETMTVRGGYAAPRGGTATTFGEAAGAPQSGAGNGEAQLRAKLRQDDQIRFDELTRLRPELPFDVRYSIAQRSGDFEQYVGAQTDPRVAAARLVGGAISGDVRYSPKLLRSLALGRVPSPADLTARDFANLPPDLQQAFISVIGPDELAQFGF